MKELDQRNVEELKVVADRIRRHVIEMVNEVQSGHPSTALSATDIICTLYFHVMNVKPDQPNWERRDRFILSKGHACEALYATLAEKGFFPVEELLTYRKINSRLQGHPCKVKTPGVEISSGSLGQGLSVGIGMALGAKMDRKDYRVYVLMSDGEQDSGQVWEAAMAAAHYKLGNLTGIIDRNCRQVDGYTEDVMNSEPLEEKWRSFGWHTVCVNGHDFVELVEAFKTVANVRSKPTVIIARTILGKGVSYMEDQPEFYASASSEQIVQALKELS